MVEFEAGGAKLPDTLHVTNVGVHQRAEDSQIKFFFNDTATTEIYTLSLHDALPI